MYRKILLIIILVLIPVAIIIFRLTKNNNEQINQHTAQQVMTTPTLPPSVPQTVFQLFPNPAQPDSEGNIDIDVSINTNNNRATGVQFVIQYDPSVLRFVSIKPDDAFYNAKVVTQNVDETSGLITYSLTLPPQTRYNSVRGDYHIAEMEFKAKHPGTTDVKIISASVISPDSTHSVLKSVVGTTVKLSE
ncbi:MAG TPA: cohesin domain-containing protein [Candidatus Saccharimonadales bacterium]|nr:cohesin domain-containing protein [Candidatus Saccharimonadales bacterium]